MFYADQPRAKARANGDKNKANVKKAIGFDKRKNFARSFLWFISLLSPAYDYYVKFVCPSHPTLLSLAEKHCDSQVRIVRIRAWLGLAPKRLREIMQNK